MTAPPRGVREACLRPQFAELYPGIEPGLWFNAATLSEHLRLRHARAGDAPDAGPRVLPPEHFEFRGGEGPVGIKAVLGRRPED